MNLCIRIRYLHWHRHRSVVQQTFLITHCKDIVHFVMCTKHRVLYARIASSIVCDISVRNSQTTAKGSSCLMIHVENVHDHYVHLTKNRTNKNEMKVKRAIDGKHIQTHTHTKCNDKYITLTLKPFDS